MERDEFQVWLSAVGERGGEGGGGGRKTLDILSSSDKCRKGTLFSGSIFFRTADLRPAE